MHKAQLTISRPMYGDHRKKIAIEIKDVDANIEFLELEIGLEEFAKALTGLAGAECEMQFRWLENVGKRVEIDTFEFECKRDKQEAIRKVKKLCPKEWRPSTYFGSQNSFFKKDGKDFARTTIRRWVEKDK